MPARGVDSFNLKKASEVTYKTQGRQNRPHVAEKARFTRS